MISDEIADLRKASEPATLYFGDDIEPHCWPVALKILRLWHRKKGSAKTPRRSDISPLEISSALPLLSIFKVSYEPFRLTCSLMGTSFVDAVGFDATGNSLHHLVQSDPVIKRAKWLIGSCEPLLLIGFPLSWAPQKSYKVYDTLCLPFLGDDKSADVIFYLNQFHSS